MGSDPARQRPTRARKTTSYETAHAVNVGRALSAMDTISRNGENDGDSVTWSPVERA